jgi:hypothetical protein
MRFCVARFSGYGTRISRYKVRARSGVS